MFRQKCLISIQFRKIDFGVTLFNQSLGTYIVPTRNSVISPVNFKSFLYKKKKLLPSTGGPDHPSDRQSTLCLELLIELRKSINLLEGSSGPLLNFDLSKG